ncbi:hypothetical protein ACJX0J_009692, partial [Zea mays]
MDTNLVLGPWVYLKHLLFLETGVTPNLNLHRKILIMHLLVFSELFVDCSTILHTPLATSLFLGLNQLDYTLNVFCSTILHTPLATSLFLGLNQLDYTLNVFCSTILHTPLATSLFLGLNQLDYTLNVFVEYGGAIQYSDGQR